MENIVLVDDYGHHPTEIEVTLQALRAAWPKRRCVMIFQPHRYTRTQQLQEEFARVLALPEQLLLLDIYAADEPPIKGISSENLLKQIIKAGAGKAGGAAARSGRQAASGPWQKPIHIKDQQDLIQLLPSLLQSEDIVITQGAGSIGVIARDLAENCLYLKAQQEEQTL